VVERSAGGAVGVVGSWTQVAILQYLGSVTGWHER